MNAYVAFYKTQRKEINADTLYDAKQKAIEQFKVRPNDAHMVIVLLAQKLGKIVQHSLS